ncbi:NUDIX hydrolase, partial [Reticulomyxa filosa]
WDGLKTQQRQLWEDFQKMFDWKKEALYEMQERCESPAIPYLPLFCAQFFKIEEAYEYKLQDGAINRYKLELLVERAERFVRYKQVVFYFVCVITIFKKIYTECVMYVFIDDANQTIVQIGYHYDIKYDYQALLLKEWKEQQNVQEEHLALLSDLIRRSVNLFLIFSFLFDSVDCFNVIKKNTILDMTDDHPNGRYASKKTTGKSKSEAEKVTQKYPRPFTIYPEAITHRRGYSLKFCPIEDKQSEDWKQGCTHYQDNISYGYLCYRYRYNHNLKDKKSIEFLVCQSKSTNNWGLIKGTFEANEDSSGYETAEREFYEETGLHVDKGNILYIDYSTYYEMFHIKKKKKDIWKKEKKKKKKTITIVILILLRMAIIIMKIAIIIAKKTKQKEQKPSKDNNVNSPNVGNLESAPTSERIKEHMKECEAEYGNINSWVKRKYNVIFICHLRENTPNHLHPPVVHTGELVCTKWVDFDTLKELLFSRSIVPYQRCVEFLMSTHNIPLHIDLHVHDTMYLQSKFGSSFALDPFLPHTRRSRRSSRLHSHQSSFRTNDTNNNNNRIQHLATWLINFFTHSDHSSPLHSILTTDGYVRVSDLLAIPQVVRQGITHLSVLRTIATHNSKFSLDLLEGRGSSKEWFIRYNITSSSLGTYRKVKNQN